MLDIGGLVLLLGSLVGALKGLSLPIWLPQLMAIAALGLVIYHGFWKRSRFLLIHSAALWIALTWIAGHMMDQLMGDGILTLIPLWLMLLMTPAVVILQYQVQRRFSTSTGKKLELKRTETTPFKEWWNSLRKKAITKKAMELNSFDLGEEIEFQNK